MSEEREGEEREWGVKVKVLVVVVAGVKSECTCIIVSLSLFVHVSLRYVNVPNFMYRVPLPVLYTYSRYIHLFIHENRDQLVYMLITTRTFSLLTMHCDGKGGIHVIGSVSFL